MGKNALWLGSSVGTSGGRVVTNIDPVFLSQEDELKATWRTITALVTVAGDGGTNLRLDIAATPSATCFLVDDAIIYRAP